jgi:hypothetical protein
MLPADNPAVFLEGLSLMRRAKDIFLKRHLRETADPTRLHRTVFLHLLQFRVKNRRQSWWGDVEDDWVRMTRALSAESGYRWYLDIGLFRFYTQLLKSELGNVITMRLF